MTRGRHRRVVAPPTRLGASEEGDLTPAGGPAVQPRQVRRPQAPAAAPEPPSTPVLPTRAREDTDEAWGDRPEGSDDARFLRDKPPHWQ
ncbi:hypothetical protein FE251_01920 [Georgenia wutianyii]|uniref:Uncharacterized protein n=1 Tax=Georgenia wutianyii TaxID=2585135 RepID=A0ABX5VKC0_9MICO|nr:hypothetical protein [Georgenia wutianyii]QDB78268.1 hypothetical protein FE251_01920 [Georgenia wutianyii]